MDMIKKTKVYRDINMVVTCETCITDYLDGNDEVTFHFNFKTYKNRDGYLTSIVFTNIRQAGEILRDETYKVLFESKVRCSKSAVMKQHDLALSQYDSIRRKAIATVIEESAK